MKLSGDIVARLVEVDPDRVRAAQLAAPGDRNALMVLYAFHAELAKVPELVSEPLIGQIRYQWWRDALEEAFAGKPVRKHEVATPLAEMLREREVARFWMDKVIDGRERDLDPRPIGSIEAATAYAKTTSGALMQAAVAVLGEEPDARVQALGTAWGLMGLARSYRFYKSGLLKGLERQALIDAADAALESGAGRLPPGCVPGVAYAALVPLYGRALSRLGPEADTKDAKVGAVRKQARLMRVAVSGKVR